jgi:methionine synthase I (cobalamin-dependent)
MMGVTPEQAAEELTRAGGDVIGANCGLGIDAYVPLCTRLHAATGRPVWIKANAGLPVFEGGCAVYKMTAEEFARHALLLVEAGAAFLGGCCGTSPGFVRALSQALAAGRRHFGF